MKNKLTLVTLGVFLLMLFQNCKQKKEKFNAEDAFASGTAKFAADESFEPILSEEEYVFKALYTDAKPVIVYKNENDVLRLLLNDSVRVGILSRNLNKNEIKILKGRVLTPEVSRFAIDAVALIVNKASNDTLITVSEIKKMLNGQIKTDKNIVFDNPNSSLVRYLKDFSGNREFKQKNIYALKSNKEVINYISRHPDAIGITGFSWLNDPDKDYANAVNNVKIVAVKDESNKSFPNEYFKPSQATLVLKQYPLSRSLYYINCTGRMGLGTGFASFLTSQRGQRIILRSGLLPDSIPPRQISIKSKLKINENDE